MKEMKEKHQKEDELLNMVEPGDLHKFGLIPEFVGRLQEWSIIILLTLKVLIAHLR